VNVEITPQPDITATVVAGDQIAVEVAPTPAIEVEVAAGPPGPSGASISTGSLTALPTVMDTVPGDFATWNVQLTNGAMRYNADINASAVGATVNWSQSGVAVVGISLPSFVLDVQRSGASLVLLGSGIGWTYRVRRYA